MDHFINNTYSVKHYQKKKRIFMELKEARKWFAFLPVIRGLFLKSQAAKINDF